MSKKILVRFDDICPTMDWEMWNKAVQTMDKYGIKPLIGVIPDCQDPDLHIDEAKPDFWEHIRSLQLRGYAIAMHGYIHVYDIKRRGIINKGFTSEFAGHSYEEQYDKIRKGKDIMIKHGIDTDVFFAPSHSFDLNTLKALKKCGFKYISDGKSCKPVLKEGIICIPSRDGGARSILPQSYVTRVFHAHEWARPGKYYNYEFFMDVCLNHSSEVISFDEYKKRACGNWFLQLLDEQLYLLWDRYIYYRIVPIINKLLHR